VDGKYAIVYKNENREYVARIEESGELVHFPNKGIGYEFQENEEIIITEMEKENEETKAKIFYKIHTLYELVDEGDGYNYTINRIKRAGEEVLKIENVHLHDEMMEELPGDIKVKIILFNKKRKLKDLELTTIMEEMLFSIQNGMRLDEIKMENQDIQFSFMIETDEQPFVVIEKDGVRKTFILKWEKEYHKKILMENNMKIPFELAEQELREINAHDIILSDIKFSEDGNIIIINGVKYYFRKKSDKEKLKELNPDLYEKICKAMLGKTLKEKDKESLKLKYKEIQVLEEEGELELRYVDEIDVLTIRSFQNYIQRMLAKEIDVPVYAYMLSDEEILYYLGDDKEISVSEFRERAKEILVEKLKELDEFSGWDGTINYFIQDYIGNKLTKTIAEEKEIE